MITPNRAVLVSILSLVFMTGAGCPSKVKLQRPITLYTGCPEYGGICEKTKTDFKAEVRAAMPDISEDELNQWIEENLTPTVRIKVLPAKAPLFSKMTCAPTDDMGVVLKAMNDFRRKAKR